MTAAAYRDDRDRRAVSDVIAGYSQLVVDRVREGWHPYLATLMFAPLPGKPAAVMEQMKAGTELVYKKFLTRAVRRPRSAWSAGWLPVLVAAPDTPVGKHDKPLAEVKINGGLHMHGVLLMPPFSRLRLPADEHFRQRQAFYVGDRSRLRAIDVRPIEADVGKAVDYALKNVRRGRFSVDDLLILPRAASELRHAR